jgi:hypothetical protein
MAVHAKCFLKGNITLSLVKWVSCQTGIIRRSLHPAELSLGCSAPLGQGLTDERYRDHLIHHLSIVLMLLEDSPSTGCYLGKLSTRQHVDWRQSQTLCRAKRHEYGKNTSSEYPILLGKCFLIMQSPPCLKNWSIENMLFHSMKDRPLFPF